MCSQEFGCRIGGRIFRGVRISIKVSVIGTGNGKAGEPGTAKRGDSSGRRHFSVKAAIMFVR
jgi:hypothetical protein